MTVVYKTKHYIITKCNTYQHVHREGGKRTEEDGDMDTPHVNKERLGL